MYETVDRLVEIDKRINKLKTEAAELESQLLAQAETDLDASKQKTKRYYGSNNNCVLITLAQTVKTVYDSMLPSVFGLAYKDMVTEKTSYTLTAPAKRLLGGVCSQDLSDMSFEEIIEQIPASIEQRKNLSKKLKGKNPTTDAKNLVNIAGLSEDDADMYAYFVQEAMISKEFEKLMQLNGISTEEQKQALMETIDAAIVVEESPKVQVIDGQGA